MKAILKVIPCYCCGSDCYDQDEGSGWKSVCQRCAFEIQPQDSGDSNHFNLSDPKDGNGFKYEGWSEELDALKQKYLKSIPLHALGGRRVYTGDCPCGIHHSLCDYHRS